MPETRLADLLRMTAGEAELRCSGRRSAVDPKTSSGLPRTARTIVAVCAGVTLAAWSAPAVAQNEAALKSSLEGARVTLRIDMPGTSDGVDVHPDSSRPLDYKRYGNRLKEYGIAIRAGESATVTLVKMKKDLIEFQLNGGGFGTFSDDTSTSVHLPFVEKSEREEELEKRIKDEGESRRRREVERELNELRQERDRENRQIEAQRAALEERKRERIARQRLTGGSRFNLRYVRAVPPGIKPVEVMAALGDYVDFAGAAGVPQGDAALVAAEPEPPADDSMPRKGMTRADAEREFGKPTTSSDRSEGTLTVTTLVFIRGEQLISAEFVEDVLVRYSITSR